MLISFADITCGHSCWYAKEENCRCSCGGKNHGALLVGGAAQPLRTSRIDGVMYYLEGADKYRTLALAAHAENGAHGWKDRDGRDAGHVYHYHWRDTDHGAPARLKPASKQQRANWPELAHLVGKPDVYLLWLRVEMPRDFSFCALGTCVRCDEMRAALKP